MRIKTLKELAELFKNGTLKEEEWILVLDNDISFLQYVGDSPFEKDSWQHESFAESKEKEFKFQGKGYNDLEEACNAAGIPTRWC